MILNVIHYKANKIYIYNIENVECDQVVVDVVRLSHYNISFLFPNETERDQKKYS